MWQQKRIAVVVPAFNESERIGLTLAGIPAFVDCVIVVDDASNDATAELVSNVAEARVHVVRHSYNQGVGAAIRTGYRAGVKLGVDIVVVMAADNQMAPEDVEPLLSAMQHSDADYVKGNRFLHPDHAAMPTLRRWGSGFLSWLTRLTTGYAVDDCQCGFTALRATTIERLGLDELWPRYGYPNDLLALLKRINATVVDVPVKPVYAGEGSGLHAGYMATISARIVKRGLERWLRAEPAPARQFR